MQQNSTSRSMSNLFKYLDKEVVAQEIIKNGYDILDKFRVGRVSDRYKDNVTWEMSPEMWKVFLDTIGKIKPFVYEPGKNSTFLGIKIGPLNEQLKPTELRLVFTVSKIL